MCLPALCLLSFQLDRTRQAQDLPKIHLSTSTPPLQNNHGSFVILSSKENQKTPFGGRVVLIMCLPALCLLAFQLDHTGQTQDLPKIHLSTSTPPSKTTTGPLSSCLLKRNQKNTIWRKGSSHYVPTCTMSPVFSTRPNKTSPRLAKDSPFNFHPPLQNNHGSFVILSSKENQKTPFGGRVVLIMCLPALCLLAFQLDHTGQTQDLPKIHLSTSTPPPLQNNHGSFVILSSKENQKNTIWRKGSSHYVPTCTMSPVFSTRPNKTSPRLAKDSPFNFHPPPKQQQPTGPL